MKIVVIMDFFAHVAWSYLFFHKTKKPWYAILFGILPDTFSWLFFTIYLLFKGQTFMQAAGSIPEWVFALYNITHSLFTFLFVLLIVYMIWRTIPIYIWAWPIHILIDIPTHSRDFLPTPFLWPVSEWVFPGISWGTPWFMFTNWGLITFLMVTLFIIRKQKK